jgi:hypothetical protein
MPMEWIRGFRRRTQVEAGYDELVRDYVRRYGHTPSRTVQIQLAQQATLANRPTKTALRTRTLADQIADWTRHARELLPNASIRDVIAGCLNRPTVSLEYAPEAIAAAVVDVVSANRATWNVFHIRAEAHRQLRPVDFPGAEERMAAVETVSQLALARGSVLLDFEVDPVPTLLQRPDGESVFTRHGSQRYTSEQILSAEQRLVDASQTRAGPVVSRFARDLAIRRFEKSSRKKVQLNPGQRALVEHFVSSGLALAVGIGPPGTGKSTAMRAVREAWETIGGRVLGFAPSAVAAGVLGDELGVRANTIHSLLFARALGVDLDISPGDMLLVDEAGMADTRSLDGIRAIAAEHGAVVRLVGDHRQLSAVEAGGALRLIYHDSGGVELTDVRRFADPAEAEAVLRFRVGDPRAIGFYTSHGRLFGGVRAVALDKLYADWTTDVAAGRTSIMMSDSTDVASELSARAQAERRVAGTAELGGVELHDGTFAGVGDRIVTRKNRRRLAVLGGKDYVKNGDLWEIEKRFQDGRLRVRHVQHRGRITLPAWYVNEWVELGYAATVHRSQGMTVDTARAFLTAAATREAALVALSRGVYGNFAYLDTETVLHPDEPAILPGDLFTATARPPRRNAPWPRSSPAKAPNSPRPKLSAKPSPTSTCCPRSFTNMSTAWTFIADRSRLNTPSSGSALPSPTSAAKSTRTRCSTTTPGPRYAPCSTRSRMPVSTLSAFSVHVPPNASSSPTVTTRPDPLPRSSTTASRATCPIRRTVLTGPTSCPVGSPAHPHLPRTRPT